MELYSAVIFEYLSWILILIGMMSSLFFVAIMLYFGVTKLPAARQKKGRELDGLHYDALVS
ncbi:MAG: hypothetical protein ACOYUZ_05270 [Patescibacteria group bacterium]